MPNDMLSGASKLVQRAGADPGGEVDETNALLSVKVLARTNEHRRRPAVAALERCGHRVEEAAPELRHHDPGSADKTLGSTRSLAAT